MNIEEYFNNFYKGTKNPTLKAMEYFMEELGHPEKELKVIHIAGTNGKGSVTEMLSNILTKNGYKVGKYISPHLVEYNERISISGQNITDREMENIIKKMKEKIEKYNQISDTKVTLFELLTTIALYYFKQKNCDFVVLETGLGGLYDCTNIVKPIVSIITSISYDHMEILGKTLEEIATQKVGIIKEKSNTVVVEQKQSVQKIIEETCSNKNNTLKVVKKIDIQNRKYEDEFLTFDYKENKSIKINLKGEKQFENASLCLETINILKQKGYKITEKAIKEGLSTVIHKARFETINKEPKIIFDGGHNEEAILNFINTVNTYYKKEEKIYIVSILKTKDYETVLKHLLKDENSIFIFTNGNDKERYVSSKELYETAKKMTNNEKLYQKNLQDAILYAKSQKEKVSFIVGSFYIYRDGVKTIKSCG